jgi:hypothetical protein
MIVRLFGRTKIILVLASIWLQCGLAQAVIWENIPVPPQTETLKREEASVNNIPIQSTVYSSRHPPQEIIEFYKTKLINFGWRLESQISQQGLEQLVFSKENELVNIMLQNILDKNFITVTQSKKWVGSLKEKSSCLGCEEKLPPTVTDVPSFDTPGKDLQFVPRYPQAVRVNHVERERGKKVILAYYTSESVETVTDFYLQNMGNYYWTLEDEIDFQNLPETLTEEINVDIQGKSLVFKSPIASCIISIIEEPQNKATIIGINYNEK